MPSVNLAPGTQYILEARRRRQRLFAISLVLITVTAIIWAGLFIYVRQLNGKLTTIENQTRDVELKIAQLDTESTRIVLFENRLNALDALLNHHISFDALLGDVERLLPADIALVSMEVQTDTGSLQIQAHTPNIDEVAQTLASLTNGDNHETVFTQATFNNLSRTTQDGTDGAAPTTVYNFQADLSFDPAILRTNQ